MRERARLRPADEHFGDRIRDWRVNEAHWSQDRLAREIPVTGQTVRNWECGRTHPGPTQMEVARLAEVMGRSVAWLLYGVGEEK